MRTVDSNLLQALHEGIFEKPLWTSFLNALRVQTRATYVAFVFRPPDEPAMSELYSGERPAPHLQALFRDKFVQDPLPYQQMREGRVYALDELIDPADPLHRSYQHELLMPWGVSHMRAVRIAEPSGTHAWLSCSGGRAVGSAVSAQLAGLVPHLRLALRSLIALRREQFRTSISSEAFRKLNYGWLTLDKDCRIVDAAPHMEQLFERASVLRRGRADRLMIEAPTVDRQLTALVQGFARDPAGRPGAISLSRDPMMDMLVAPIQERMMLSSARPVAIAYVRGDLQSKANRCEQLVDLFGLLPSEARLAWAMAQGLTISEAAEELGITVETARYYSKKVYAKTGARGQADLVRNILTSVLAVA